MGHEVERKVEDTPSGGHINHLRSRIDGSTPDIVTSNIKEVLVQIPKELPFASVLLPPSSDAPDHAPSRCMVRCMRPLTCHLHHAMNEGGSKIRTEKVIKNGTAGRG